MCLHGTAQSGQEQDMARSWARSGKRERPQLENTSSMWRGISPARSFALYRARAARADSTRAQSASPKRPSPMLTRYGRALDPWTRALTVPAVTPTSASPRRPSRDSLPFPLLLRDRLRRERDQLAEPLGGQLREPALAAADDQLGERLLLLDQRVDPLLQRADADELADLHVLALADAEGAVGRLVLHGRVPPAVEVDQVVGGGAGPARPESGPPGRRAAASACRREGTPPRGGGGW